MELRLERNVSNDVSTIGTLSIDGNYACRTLEPAYHETKISGKTRIPEGTYKIKLTHPGASKFDPSYNARFGWDWYKGMLQLQDVPNFEGVEIHIGNSAKDTEACILVGKQASDTLDAAGSFTISESTSAFRDVYPLPRDVLVGGGDGDVNITIVDLDR